MFKDKRSVFKFGPGSRGIVLPKKWLNYHEEEHPLTHVTLMGDSILIVAANRKQERKARAVLEMLEDKGLPTKK